jgi:hypothetical protein
MSGNYRALKKAIEDNPNITNLMDGSTIFDCLASSNNYEALKQAADDFNIFTDGNIIIDKFIQNNDKNLLIKLLQKWNIKNSVFQEEIEFENYVVMTEEIEKSGIIIPEELLCPISRTLMLNPVITEAGHIYEKINIKQWLENNNTDPCTGIILTTKKIYPVHSHKNRINEFLVKINYQCYQMYFGRPK